MAEWLKAAVLKTVRGGNLLVGSNPTSSAIESAVKLKSECPIRAFSALLERRLIEREGILQAELVAHGA